MTEKHKSAAHTSKADRVLDALQEVRQEPSAPKYQCQKCGCTSYNTRKPLGGPLIMFCAQCGSRTMKGAQCTTALLPENLNHNQGDSRGPTRSSFSTSSAKPDKHEPAYRHKGKGQPND